MTRTGFIAIIGLPNVGKSTLMNHLIGQKIAITSNKPQTTRKRIRTIYTDERGQMIFIDTPGILTPSHALSRYMQEAAVGVLRSVDLVLWITEAGKRKEEKEREIRNLLLSSGKQVFLVQNKIDTMKADALEEDRKTLEALLPSAKIFQTAALKDQGVSDLRSAIFDALTEGPLLYDEDMVTSETIRDISAEIIREKALRFLRDEIPHGIAVMVEGMKEREDGELWDVHADIIVERDSHKGMVIGKGGSMLKQIGSEARKDMEELIGCRVNLKLFVKVRRDWRSNRSLVQSYGYREKDL